MRTLRPLATPNCRSPYKMVLTKQEEHFDTPLTRTLRTQSYDTLMSSQMANLKTFEANNRPSMIPLPPARPAIVVSSGSFGGMMQGGFCGRKGVLFNGRASANGRTSAINQSVDARALQGTLGCVRVGEHRNRAQATQSSLSNTVKSAIMRASSRDLLVSEIQDPR